MLVPTCRSSPGRAIASISDLPEMVAPPMESATIVNAPSMANVVSQLTPHFDLEISSKIDVPPIMTDAITAQQHQGLLDVTNNEIFSTRHWDTKK
jgi:hypothetical protein